MVLKEIIFNSLYLLWEGVVVLKELIFNIFTLGGFLKEQFYTLGGCDGHERNDF